MATAKVRVTLEIDVGSSWGNECKLDQIFDQASKEALGLLNHMIAEYKDEYLINRIKLVGKPEVDAIIVPKR